MHCARPPNLAAEASGRAPCVCGRPIPSRRIAPGRLTPLTRRFLLRIPELHVTVLANLIQPA